MERKDLIELYDRYIAYTRHENELFHQRTTWFLALQSGLILLLAYGTTKASWPSELLLGQFSSLPPGSLLPAIPIAFLSGFGAYVAFRAGPSLKAAKLAQNAIEAEWRSRFEAEADKVGLPRLMGGGSTAAARRGGRLATELPGIMLGAWSFLFLVSGALAIMATIDYGGRAIPALQTLLS